MKSIWLLLLFLLLPLFIHTKHIKERHLNWKNSFEPKKNVSQQIEDLNGGDLTSAVFDIIESFPISKIVICHDITTGFDFIDFLTKKFFNNSIALKLFNITTPESQDKYFDFLTSQVSFHYETYTIFFCSHKLYEHILLEIDDRNLIRRNLIYIFNWGRKPVHRYFMRNLGDTMKVYVITNPRYNAFRLYYNQALAHKQHHLEMINWWLAEKGLFKHPTFPNAKNVYKDFQGKFFLVPVIHKPPWHFVKYNPDKSFNEVEGGRDDKILTLLADKLNFKFKYFDPPERMQGSSVSENGTFKGVLGLISKRKADLFIGDVALTLERSNFVEFSFITLADSGAFVTHAPSKLNEALALLRPFQWKVWPAIGVTFLVVGPVLYAIIALPNCWQPRFRVRSHTRLFFDCTWFTTTILLKQTGKEPSSSHKARFFIILLSICATYVVNDMYSANLTSLLARPGREKAINNLHQLEEVMAVRDYNLYVETHSSTYSLLENGTGIYGRLWERMTRGQHNYLVESVEEGVKLVMKTTNVAVIAGRETLYFDTQRFGANNFHLSEKLNTAYSAIALQIGCPYIEEINKILMAVFEAGIITKMTENEYEKLGKQKMLSESGSEDNGGVTGGKKETRRAAKASEDSEKLQPISFKMLQGCFYLLAIGNALAGIILIAEILVHRHHRSYRRKTARKFFLFKKMKRFCASKIRKMFRSIRGFYRRLMHDAFVSTLEYLE